MRRAALYPHLLYLYHIFIYLYQTKVLRNNNIIALENDFLRQIDGYFPWLLDLPENPVQEVLKGREMPRCFYLLSAFGCNNVMNM